LAALLGLYRRPQFIVKTGNAIVFGEHPLLSSPNITRSL
jgi:hypothetical protein